MPDQLQIVPIPANIHFPINPDPQPLSQVTQRNIDEYWEEINHQGRFFRGPLFIIDEIEHQDEQLTVTMKESDYAHHLYAKAHVLSGAESCAIVAPIALIVTKDHYLIFGRMGEQTAKPNVIQCVGGGLDHEDVVNNEIDIIGNLGREVEEEVGLRVDDDNHFSSMKPFRLIYPEQYAWIATLYLLQCTMTKDEFFSHFEEHQESDRARGEEPELAGVVSVKNDPRALRAFLNEQEHELIRYLGPLLRSML